MKKFLAIFAVIFGLFFVGATNVYAEEDLLLVFFHDQDTLRINVDTGVFQLPESSIAIGDTLTFDARICPVSSYFLDEATNDRVYSKSACTPVDATFTSSMPSVITMNGNVGTVQDFGRTTITASAAGYSDFVFSYYVREVTNDENDNPTGDTPSDEPTSDITPQNPVTSDDESLDNDVSGSADMDDNATDNAKKSGRKSNNNEVKVGDTASNSSMLIIIAGVALMGVGCYLIILPRKDELKKLFIK